MTPPRAVTLEYGLIVRWDDGEHPEIVPARDPDHARQMARQIYAGLQCITVAREIQPWRYCATVNELGAEVGD